MGAFKVGTDLAVELTFRTSKANGVLIGISGKKMDGLGIELVDGKVSDYFFFGLCLLMLKL